MKVCASFIAALSAMNGIGLTAAAFAADNSLGTWKRNLEKSKFTPGTAPLKSLTMVREPDGDGAKMNVTRERADGKPVTAAYTAKYDGSPAFVSGAVAPYDSASIKRVNANTYTWDAKSSTTKYHSRGEIVISPDGKTMTLKAKGTGQDGKPMSVTLVYEKQ
jgi:hypothetical protein